MTESKCRDALMHEQRNQDNDGDWYAKKKQQQ